MYNLNLIPRREDRLRPRVFAHELTVKFYRDPGRFNMKKY